MRLLKASLAVAVLALAAVACSSTGTTKTEATTSKTTAPYAKPIAAPAGLPAFYSVPQPLPAKAGTLIKSEPVAVPDLHGQAYRVMYTSQSLDSKPIAVSGLVVVPQGAAPKDGYPIVTWAHGTNGMADKCAPSLDPANDVPLANSLLDRGWLVTASDYRGEGTPGLMPYIAGETAARDTIDIVRAARVQLPKANAGTKYLVWGHSEGGHTAMFSLRSGAKYAPDLQLVGVVAGAPPSQFKYIYNYLKGSPYRYYLLMAAGGLNAAYGDRVPLEQVLTPEGMAMVPELDKGCTDVLSAKFGSVDVSKVTKGDPFEMPAWKKVISENDPQSFTTSVTAPLLIIQGGNDEQIPVVSTKLLADHLCDVGQDLHRWIYPGQSHSGVIAPSSPDMLRWIDDRFAGTASSASSAPTGQPDIEATDCKS